MFELFLAVSPLLICTWISIPILKFDPEGSNLQICTLSRHPHPTTQCGTRNSYHTKMMTLDLLSNPYYNLNHGHNVFFNLLQWSDYDLDSRLCKRLTSSEIRSFQTLSVEALSKEFVVLLLQIHHMLIFLFRFLHY